MSKNNPNSEASEAASAQQAGSTNGVDYGPHFWESIVSNIPNMIFVKDAKELRFVLFNKAGEHLLGVSNKDLLGKSDKDFFPPEQAQHFIRKDREVLDSRKLLEIPEEVIDTPNGKRYLHTRKIPILDKDGDASFLLGISWDITEARAQRQLIAQQQQALASASKLSSLGEMAGGIAHEINNPLSIINGFANLLEMRVSANNCSDEFVLETA